MITRTQEDSREMRNDPAHDGEPQPAALSDALRARDAGLRFVGRINRWMIAAAVALAGGLTALTAHAFHAHAATPSTASSAGAVSTVPATSVPPSGDTVPAPAVQPPQSAPTPGVQGGPGPGPVVSGGS
jgi:hypothetical protein